MAWILNWFSKSTPLGLLFLAFVVGIGGAFGAAIFHELILLLTTIFYGTHGEAGFISHLDTIPIWQRLLIPAFGGLLIGVIYKLTKVTEAEGEGVPEVMEALAHKKGNIRPVVAPIKIITAAITLGSGGSAGREGPVIQIGSAIGSAVGQFFKQQAPEKSLLLAAGAAAAIGGAFGAPIAGVLFTIEILRHKPSALRVSILVVAAFTGAIGARLLTGYEGLRFTSEGAVSYDMFSLGALLVLSITAVGVALFFGKILNAGRTIFTSISIPHVAKPAFGGLAIGFVSLLVPHIHEPATYPLMVDLISLTTLPLSFLLLFLLVKIIATSITLGSGGSGGIFAPLLLMGAVTGSIVGNLVSELSLIDTSLLPVLVLCGMAGVFSAAAHAPFTAVLIIYEMTGDISLIIPLILVCLIASLLSKKISTESIYHHEV